MVVFFAAWTGIPLWSTLRHSDTGPVTLPTARPANDVAAAALPPHVPELLGAR
ncbi:MAG: hypothetical protein ACRDOK_10795 [Streptosporangiaceae bacterium]